MKLIGLLGGTSWPSTISYYEILNRALAEHSGGFHSARILLYSIDYHSIKSSYQGGWERIPALLADEIRLFLEKKPDCLIICNNTLHRAFDQIRDSLDLSIPVFHAGHLAVDEAVRLGCKTVLLLGTAFTMEDGFFARYFEQRNIQVMIPDQAERQAIQERQSQIAAGNNQPSFRKDFAAILKKYHTADAVVLACTELPLAIDETNSPLPIINPVLCQCDAALEFALDEGKK